MRGSRPSLPDPYRIYVEYTEIPDATVNGRLAVNLGWNYTDDRTKVSKVIGTGTGVIITAGQSLSSNSVNAQYTPVHTVDNYNFMDGSIYTAKDPLLGSDIGYAWPTGCYATRLGDKMIAAGKFTRVVLVSIALGGTTVGQWAAGGGFNHRIAVCAARLAADGITPTYVLWHQGESDTQLGTSQSTYATRMQSVIDQFRAHGISCPIFVAQASWLAGATNSGIIAAQASVVNIPAGVYPGPNTDTLNATYRQADNTHMTATGADTMADMFVSAIGTYF